MRILNDRQASDEETLVFAMTVVNKTLNGVPDQDTFFDVIDALESQGMEEALPALAKMGNSQLTQQCEHYEAELRREDAALESGSNDEAMLAKMRCENVREINWIHLDQTRLSQPNWSCNSTRSRRFGLEILIEMTMRRVSR